MVHDRNSRWCPAATVYAMGRWIARSRAAAALRRELDHLADAEGDLPVVVVVGGAEGSGRHFVARQLAARSDASPVELATLPSDAPHRAWIPARDRAAAAGASMIVGVDDADDADRLRPLLHAGAPAVIIVAGEVDDLDLGDVVRLRVPSLGQRHADLPELADLAARDAARALRRSPPPSIDAAALDAIGRHDWSAGEPPHAAGMWHAMRCAVLAAGDGQPITLGHLPRRIQGAVDLTPGRTLAAIEREYVIRTVRAHGDRMGAAAASLGIGRHALWRRLRRWGVRGAGQGA